MNHLCGLPLPREAIDIYWNKRLSEDETKSLDDFEEAHTQRKPNNANEDSTPVFAGLNDAIGDDGWRELDRFTLYRFLCADKLDGEFQPDKSMDRLHRALRYRKESNTDVILNWWLDEEEKEKEEDEDEDEDEKTAFVPSSIPNLDPGFSRADLDKYQRIRIQRFTGRDKVGQPVSFVRLGAFLGSGNSSQFTIDQWIRFYIWDLERTYVEMRKAAREVNQPIEKYVFCGDCQGMVSAIMNGSIWSVLKLLKALKSVEDYYPEYVDRIILFNAPRVAAVFYRAAKALLDPNTASKLVIHSSSNYETVFSEFLPLEAIPFEYGGTSMVEYPLTASQ